MVSVAHCPSNKWKVRLTHLLDPFNYSFTSTGVHNREVANTILSHTTRVLTVVWVYCHDRKFEQPIFIRGGNWILLGGLLRLSEDRYNIDVGSHADINFAAINLNMICMWRGALDE